MFNYSIEYLNENNIWTVLTDWTRPIINKNTLDESHDETQIFLSASAIDQPFRPFTRFIINITEYDGEIVKNVDTLYRVVILDEVEQVFFEGAGLYDHDIRLSEASKELERYTVDNLSFTNEWAKAFQTSNAPFVIKDFAVYDNTWYTDASENIPSDVGDGWFTYTCYQLFSDYNTFDAGGASFGYNPKIDTKPNLFNTYVGKVLNQYNYPADYSFNKSVVNAVIVGNSISIPTLTVSDIPTKYILYMIDPVSALFKYDVWLNFFKSIDSVQIVSPSGVVTNVTQGSSFSFTELGRYRLRYNVSRKMQSYRLNRWRRLNTLIEEHYSPVYNASTVTLEFEIFSFATLLTVTDKLSVYDILNKLTYTTPTRFYGDTNIKYSLYYDGTDNSIFNRYANIEAPEMIFTNKNLWEALREVGGIINAIPYLHIKDKDNWDIIDFFPLSSEERISDKVEEDYSNSTSYYDSENYTGCYDLSVDNMISPVSTDDGYISEAGYKISKSIRSEEVEISETSMNIETVYPIYKVNTLKYVNYNLSPTIYDITVFLQESALYETLPSNSLNTGKSVTLCYTQGRKNITGLNYKVSKNDYTDAVNVVSIKQIIQQVTGQTITGLALLQSKFIVEYIPFINARVKIYKPNAPKIGIDTSMFQNQSANVIDARALGKKMTANISRVGNLGYVDSVRVYSLDNIPTKGQRSKDGYFVSTVTTEYDQEDILSSIQYTKDFQKISDWINIANLQRYYEVSEKQSIHRYINPTMFYVYGDAIAELKKENGLNQKIGYTDKNYIADLLLDYGSNRKINASLLTAYSDTYSLTTDTNYLANKNYYKADETSFGLYTLFTDYVVGDPITEILYEIKSSVISRVYLNTNAIAVGNNISIITDYMDNYGAGYQAVGYNDSGGVGNTNAFMNRSIPYSDNYGKIDHILVENITDSNIVYPTSSTLETNINKLALSLPAITDIDPVTLQPIGEDYITIADSYQGNNKPTFSKIGCSQDIDTKKDSREIIHINQQHHFLINDTKVVLGNMWTEGCRYIQNITDKYKLVFLKNELDTYEFNIKSSDIIAFQNPLNPDLDDIYNKIVSLGTEITLSNIDNILSTTNNNEPLYILPSLEYNGLIVGLQQPAYAWAIVTKDTNKLLIGKNEFINNTNLVGDNTVATAINQSITNEY